MDDGWWIVFGVLGFVLLFNLGLIFSALRYRKSNPDPLFGKSISDLLNPWKAEDEALDDLHNKIQALTGEDHE
ncbi:MAG: hypothetical protein PVH60_04370 [Anaerolineales bacterium]|jgi:hypothetical protein